MPRMVGKIPTTRTPRDASADAFQPRSRSFATTRTPPSRLARKVSRIVQACSFRAHIQRNARFCHLGHLTGHPKIHDANERSSNACFQAVRAPSFRRQTCARTSSQPRWSPETVRVPHQRVQRLIYAVERIVETHAGEALYRGPGGDSVGIIELALQNEPIFFGMKRLWKFQMCKLLFRAPFLCFSPFGCLSNCLAISPSWASLCDRLNSLSAPCTKLWSWTMSFEKVTHLT